MTPSRLITPGVCVSTTAAITSVIPKKGSFPWWKAATACSLAALKQPDRLRPLSPPLLPWTLQETHVHRGVQRSTGGIRANQFPASPSTCAEANSNPTQSASAYPAERPEREWTHRKIRPSNARLIAGEQSLRSGRSRYQITGVLRSPRALCSRALPNSWSPQGPYSRWGERGLPLGSPPLGTSWSVPEMAHRSRSR